MTETPKGTPNIYERLFAVMGDVSFVRNDGKADPKIGGFHYASHDAVAKAVRPALIKHRIFSHALKDSFQWTQDGNRTTVCFTVRFVNVDNPEDFIDVPAFGQGVDGSDKGPGKAMSYAWKYVWFKLLALETGDDADAGAEEYQPGDRTSGRQTSTSRDRSRQEPAPARASEATIDRLEKALIQHVAEPAEQATGRTIDLRQVLDWLVKINRLPAEGITHLTEAAAQSLIKAAKDKLMVKIFKEYLAAGSESKAA